MIVYVLLKLYDKQFRGGNKLWKAAVEYGVCQSPRRADKKRSWQAMREHFTKTLVRKGNMKKLKLDKSIYKVFANGHRAREPATEAERSRFRDARKNLIETHIDDMPQPLVQLWLDEKAEDAADCDVPDCDVPACEVPRKRRSRSV